VRSVFAICLLAAGCGLSRPADRYRVTIDLGPSIRALGADDLFESGPAEDRIVAIGPAALPALEAALDDESPAVRVGVVGVLNLLAVPARVPLLMKAATDSAEDVRAAFDGETATSGDVIAMGLGSVRNRRGMRNGGLKASTPAWESVKLATTGEPGQAVLAMRCNRSPASSRA